MGTVISFSFVKMTNGTKNFWYDQNHATGFVVGFNIMGPLVESVISSLNLSPQTLLRIAVIGDSTTAYCTKRWKTSESEAQLRRQGLQKYLDIADLADFNVTVKYYSVSGSRLDRRLGGFLHQLGCVLADHSDHPFDALIMIGGWNNEYVDENDMDKFIQMLRGDLPSIRYWSGDDWRRKLQDEKYFTSYPVR